MSRAPPPPRLITIALSHYCEKARWALDHAGIAYREEPHLPLLHRRYTARVGARSVPVLVTDSEVLPDSPSIMRWASAVAGARCLYPVQADLQEQVLELERLADRMIGPHVRRWAYSHLLDEPQLLHPCFARGLGRLERATLPAVMAVARPLIRRGYRIDASTGRTSLDIVEQALQQVGAKLADSGNFLVGDRLTAADIAVASLTAPLLYPPLYGSALPPLEDLPAAMRADIVRVRATRTGRYVLDLYASERRRA